MPRTKKETLEDEVIIEEKKAKKATTKATTAKSTAKKATAKRTTAKKTATKAKATTAKRATTTKKKAFVDVPEYYDLPYKYSKTVVKVLAQNPNTLFVYWEVSDSDVEKFKKDYGENFFYITKPVLVIHNLTDDYTFELDVDDFANNWYVHVEDASCEYSVELCRRPNQSDKIENITEKQYTDFINVSYSNTIEIPNDHVLFIRDNEKIYFKNIKTNKVTERVFKSSTYGEDLKSIYNNYDLSENDDRFDLNNPSSGNPTSNVM